MTDLILKNAVVANSSIENKINSLDICNQTSYEIGGDLLKALKDTKKALESDRKTITQPLNQSLKAINAKYKPVSEQADNLIKLLNDKMGAFALAEKKRVEAEEAERKRKLQAKLEEEIQEEEIFGDKAYAEKLGEYKEQRLDIAEKETKERMKNATSANTEFSNTSVRTVWKFQIVDESKLEREYLTADEKAIKEAVKSGEREIAGVRIYEDTTIISR